MTDRRGLVGAVRTDVATQLARADVENRSVQCRSCVDGVEMEDRAVSTPLPRTGRRCLAVTERGLAVVLSGIGAWYGTVRSTTR